MRLRRDIIIRLVTPCPGQTVPTLSGSIIEPEYGSSLLIQPGWEMNIEPENVLKAALWHDAVYVFGASNNEELSATALLDFDASHSEAADLIRLTTIDEHLSDRINFESNPKASILLDAARQPSAPRIRIRSELSVSRRARRHSRF